VTRLNTFARVIRHFGEFGASGHCLILILKVTKGFCPFLLRKENFVLLSANLLRESSWITSFRQKKTALKGWENLFFEK
jgi:hypothetical protein